MAAAVLVVLVVGGTAGWWFFLRGDDGVKPAAYAAAVCPDISGWRSDILAAGDKLGQDLDQADGRSDQKRIAKQYYSDAAVRTDQLIPELERIQSPNGEDNEEYASELADSARTADDRFHNLAAQVDELEPAGKASFKAALQILTSNPESPLQAVTALVAKGRPPADIDDAFAAESSCQNLR